MRIGIIGAGNVGRTLATKFREVGHEVVFGVRDAEEADEFSNREVVERSEVLLLAVPFEAIGNALETCGDFGGKVLIDATNPLEFRDKGLKLSLGFDTSGGEVIQDLAENARVVKCFNQIGFEKMKNPNGAVMFVCGDDETACDLVKELSKSIGFDSINIGGLEQARLLEPFAALWIHLAFTTELGRSFGFDLNRA